MVRRAIISDEHSNLEALVAVLRDIDKQKVDEIISLGDGIGYGADPEACIDLKRKHCSIALIGNHEAAVLGYSDLEEFRAQAAESIRWTAQKLQSKRRFLLSSKNEQRLHYLETLEWGFQEEGVLYVHGSPRDPLLEYLSSGDIAILNPNSPNIPAHRKKEYNSPDYIFQRTTVLEKLKTNFKMIGRVCFNGHNHIPCINIQLNGNSEIPLEEANQGYGFVFPNKDSLGSSVYELGEEKVVINVGSVGQPRNCDPRASYFIYDNKKQTVECRRVSYDIKKAARKIRALGFDYLADRLLKGE